MSSTLYKKAYEAYKRLDIKTAHAICVSIINVDPQFHQSYYLLGAINNHVHSYMKAVGLFKRAIAITDLPKYRIHLAKSYSLLGISDAVVAITNSIDLSHSLSEEDLDMLGVSLSVIGMHDKALTCFTKAIVLTTSPEVLYNYAVSAKFCGEHNNALDALYKAIRLRPKYHQAHFALADLTKGAAIKEHINQLNMLLSHYSDKVIGKTDITAVLHYSHALAKEYEKQNQFQLEFETLMKAKQLKAIHMPYDPTTNKYLFDNLHQTLQHKPSICNNPQGNSASASSDRPIFVVGMPRSGTTLVERILSSHSEVTSGGELEDFSLLMKHASKSSSNSVLDNSLFTNAHTINYQKLAIDYLARTAHIGDNIGRFVDKLPFNFFYLPFIRQAFPQARIICMLREPMDTCVGNYRQLFSIQNPHYNYTQSLQGCAEFYSQFKTWIQAWSRADEVYTKIVFYDDLVNEPEQYIRQILAFCDLEWQSQCLAIESNSTPVSTASKMQIREPINQNSIGKWKRYRPFTDEIEEYFVKASQNKRISN